MNDVKKLADLTRKVLIARAKKRMTITYGNLAKVLKVQPLSKIFRDALYLIAEEDGRNLPMLTSIVVYPDQSSKTIGNGFLLSAQKLGRDTINLNRLLEQEQEATYQYYA